MVKNMNIKTHTINQAWKINRKYWNELYECHHCIPLFTYRSKPMRRAYRGWNVKQYPGNEARVVCRGDCNTSREEILSNLKSYPMSNEIMDLSKIATIWG